MNHLQNTLERLWRSHYHVSARHLFICKKKIIIIRTECSLCIFGNFTIKLASREMIKKYELSYKKKSNANNRFGYIIYFESLITKGIALTGTQRI